MIFSMAGMPFRSSVVRFFCRLWPAATACSSLSFLGPKKSSVPSVSTALGAMALTLIQSRPSSRASARVMPMTAAFDVA